MKEDSQGLPLVIEQSRRPLGRRRWTARVLLLWLIPINLMTGAWLAHGSRPAWGAEPEIVARVNGDPVTRAELQRQLQKESGVRENSDGKELESLALRELIKRQLILQEGGRRNFTITEKDLDRSIAVLRRGFGDLESFGVWMREQGLDENSLFDAVRAGMLTNRVKAALVEGVRIGDEQVQGFYEAHKEELVAPGAVRLRIIALRERGAAEAVLAALRRGTDFATMARSRSMGRLAAKGGDMGWVDPLTLPAPLREGVAALKVGEISGLLQRDGDLFIARLEERRPERRKTLAEARPAIESHLLAARQQEVVQAWLKEQEAKSRIEVFLQPASSEGGQQTNQGEK